MNPYIGKTCPYCKGIINETDDIVICSKCEMPHHKDCWVENQGCTTFGCNGTIQNIPPIASEMFDTSLNDDFDIDIYDGDADFSASYCPKCGSVHNQNERFCGHCGYDFTTFKDININNQSAQTINHAQQSYTGYSNNISNSTANYYQSNSYGNDVKSQNTVFGSHSFDEYVYKNTSYYAEDKIAIQKDGNCSFNFGAFWFSGYWYAYRKMFGKGLLFTLLIGTLCVFGWIGWIIAIGIKIYIGVSATKNYINQIDSYQRTEASLSGIAKDEFYNKHKGTNIGYPILIILIISVIAALIGTIWG